MNPMYAQATSGQLAAGIGSQRDQGYHGDAGNVKMISPNRDPLDREVDGVALGTLLLGLQRPDLSPFVRRHGYGLVDQWTRQLVDARHPAEVVG